MPKIILKDLTKSYEENINAVDRVSLTIKKNESVAIVGASGSGKTTLLRLIAGLEEPTSGSITFDNQDMKGVKPKDRHIAMLFQHSVLYPNLNVFNNIAISLKLSKPRPSKEDINKAVNEIANLTNIAHLLKRKPATLSGGERQRVALASALIKHAPIVLLDEPSSDLDVATRTKIREQIKKVIKAYPATMILVTHDIKEAKALAKTIVVLDQGKIQKIIR